jgi:hypothetical protein
VADPKIIQSMLTENNAHFDKHPFTKNLLKRLMGETILF